MGIATVGVSKRFNDVVAVDDVSIDVPEGSLTALLGPSGCGKSTLLRMVAGLEEPDAGRVLVEGVDVTHAPPRDRGVGFVFQHYAPFRHLTVRRNVAFALEVRRRPKQEIRERVDELLHLVQLEALAERYPSQISGGQRQMVAMGRALMSKPRLLMLDEPSAGLSPRYVLEIFEHIVTVNKAGVAILMVEQNARQALAFASRGFVLAQGQNRFTGTGPELIADPEVAKSFLGG